MDFFYSDLQREIRASVRALCDTFGPDYWRQCDAERRYPEEFVRAMSAAGWLGILIPEEYGGGGQGITEASIVLEEINHSGGSSAVCHAQMYTMGALLRHGSEEQKRRYLPGIASGALRLQAFGVTEPDAGSDTTRIKTFARKTASGYLINGQKVFTSRYQHSDLMVLLARTTPIEDARKKTDGLSLFLVDTRAAGDSIQAKPIDMLINHETNQLFINDLEAPQDALIGDEGRGFSYLLDGLNAERILIASECVGDGHWFIEQATAYAGQRTVFDRPIGKNQGVQFPIAKAHMSVEAADLMRLKAAAAFDAHQPCGAEANMAKYLASEASWEAADVAMATLGGYGLANEYHVERKWRETRLYRTAPITNGMILSFVAEHVLRMPRSY
ncbi:MAG TPA: acyl-CoA dehydrogenase family protein [Ktedonobacterales bacterium]|nr:acyl-CoA dehydrogenase family protein [Ktedonobacterales bacterium]